MSATRDKNQKATFVYENLYQLYRKEKETSQTAQAAIQSATVQAPLGVTKGAVLKASDANAASARVEAYNPPAFLTNAQATSPIGKRVARPQYLPSSRTAAVDSLKQNLQTLNDLHSKLKFMLQELEDLMK